MGSILHSLKPLHGNQMDSNLATTIHTEPIPNQDTIITANQDILSLMVTNRVTLVIIHQDHTDRVLHLTHRNTLIQATMAKDHTIAADLTLTLDINLQTCTTTVQVADLRTINPDNPITIHTQVIHPILLHPTHTLLIQIKDHRTIQAKANPIIHVQEISTLLSMTTPRKGQGKILTTAITYQIGLELH